MIRSIVPLQFYEKLIAKVRICPHSSTTTATANRSPNRRRLAPTHSNGRASFHQRKFAKPWRRQDAGQQKPVYTGPPTQMCINRLTYILGIHLCRRKYSKDWLITSRTLHPATTTVMIYVDPLLMHRGTRHENEGHKLVVMYGKRNSHYKFKSELFERMVELSQFQKKKIFWVVISFFCAE